MAKPSATPPSGLTAIPVPPRSRLFHLPPLGVGTAQVESLTGYLGRLAAAHAVEVASLAAAEIFPLVGATYLRNPNRNSRSAFWARSAQGINGPGTLAATWVQALETLTLRQDLAALTLRPWDGVLPSLGLLRPAAAWCPDCLEVWRTESEGVRLPLLWSLAAVTGCIQHRRPLVERCPQEDCRRLQPALPVHGPLGHCAHCGAWLGAATTGHDDRPLADDELAWQRWVTDELGRLLAVGPTWPAPPGRAVLAAALAEHIERLGGAAEFGRQLGVPIVTVTQWQHGKYTPQLPSLLRICHHLGVAPLTLLSQVPTAASPASRPTPPADAAPKSGQRRPFDAARVGQMLEEIRASDEAPPPSLRQVALRLGYSRSQLFTAFPALVAAISARFLEYQRAKALRSSEHRRAEVRRVVLALHKQGFYPSSTRVAKLLRSPVHFRHPEVVATWQELVRELGLRP